MLQRSFHCPVLEQARHRGNDAPYCWTYLDSQSCHDFPHSLAVDSVKGLCQVYKLYVEISILFLTLFLKLPCSKRHHVGSFTALPEAIRTLWEVAIGWRGFLQGSFQRWLSEESLRDCRTIACFTFTYIGGQWLQRWWTRAYLGRWWNIPPNSPGWRYSHYVALFPLVVMFQRTEAHKCSSRHYRSV